MKLTPVAPPQARQAASDQASQATAQDARARAISKLTAQQPIPLEDPSNISVEELGAVATKNEGKIVANEAQVEDKAPEAKSTEEVSYSSQLALLARKERALRAKAQQQEQSIRAREDAVKAKEAELASKGQDYDSNYISKQRLKERTLEALAEAGVSYDEVTQQQINAGSVPPAVQAYIDRLEARQAKLEADIEAGKRGAQTQQDEAYKAAVRQITQDAKDLVSSDPNFETIKATGSTKDVVELIEAHFKDTGRVMSVEEAAKLVEDHLVEEIDKLTRIEKIKKRLSPQVASESTAQKQSPNNPKQPQTMKTLTNAASSTRPLTAKERAVLAFKGELKS